MAAYDDMLNEAAALGLSVQPIDSASSASPRPSALGSIVAGVTPELKSMPKGYSAEQLKTLVDVAGYALNRILKIRPGKTPINEAQEAMRDFVVIMGKAIQHYANLENCITDRKLGSHVKFFRSAVEKIANCDFLFKGGEDIKTRAFSDEVLAIAGDVIGLAQACIDSPAFKRGQKQVNALTNEISSDCRVLKKQVKNREDIK